jgi:hypothetical protein
MKTSNIGIRIVVGWVALVIAQMITGMLIRITVPNAEGMFRWMLLTNLLMVAALGYIASRTDLRGWKLGIVLAAIPCAIGIANLIEGAVFLTKVEMPWARLGLQLFLTYLLVAPMWGWIFGRMGPGHHSSWDPKPPASKAWRFGVSDLAYVVFYFIAGMIIFPLVRDFYATQTLPQSTQIVALQLLVRGPIFIAICLLMVRLLGFTRLMGAVMVGLLFTLLSGVVPLLAPNPVFPDAVRWVHFGEVTVSNFLFAFVVGWLWGPSKEHAVLMPKHA